MPKASTKNTNVLFHEDNTYYMIPSFDVESNIVNIEFIQLYEDLTYGGITNNQITNLDALYQKDLPGLKIFIEYMNRKEQVNKGIDHIIKETSPGLYKIILNYYDARKHFMISLYDISITPATYSDDILKIYQAFIPFVTKFKREILGQRTKSILNSRVANGFTIGKRVVGLRKYRNLI